MTIISFRFSYLILFRNIIFTTSNGGGKTVTRWFRFISFLQLANNFRQRLLLRGLLLRAKRRPWRVNHFRKNRETYKKSPVRLPHAFKSTKRTCSVARVMRYYKRLQAKRLDFARLAFIKFSFYTPVRIFMTRYKDFNLNDFTYRAKTPLVYDHSCSFKDAII